MIDSLKIGDRVRIEHPFYGLRTVTVTGLDGPKNSTVNDVADCVIDGDRTWFDNDMMIGKV